MPFGFASEHRMDGFHGFNNRRRNNQKTLWSGVAQASRSPTEAERNAEQLKKSRCRRHPNDNNHGPTPTEIARDLGMHPNALDNQEWRKISQVYNDLTPSDRLRPRIRNLLLHFVDDEVAQSLLAFDKDSMSAEDAKIGSRHYPNQPKIVMLGYMRPGENFPAKKTGEEFDKECSTSPLMKALACEAIRENIIGHLSHTGMTALFQTCSTAAWLVSSSFKTYDMTMGNLRGSEYTEEELKKVAEAGQTHEGSEFRGSKYLMVAPSHREWHPLAKLRLKPTYWQTGTSVLRAFRSLRLHGSATRVLILSRVDFLDDRGVAAMVKLMPNLERLDIVGCEMFRLHMVARFVKFVAEVENERGSNIALDICPLFERGAMWQSRDLSEDPAGNYDAMRPRKGTFGLTWDDSGVKIGVATVQFLYYELLPALYAAKKQYMLQPESLLRRFLESLPLFANCVAFTIGAFEHELKKQGIIAEHEAQWVAAHRPARESASEDVLETDDIEIQLQNFANALQIGDTDGNEDDTPDDEEPEIPPFERRNWSQPLLNRVAMMDMDIFWGLVQAMYGSDHWIETFDRGTWSTTTRAAWNNWLLCAERVKCGPCDKFYPRICFSSGSICEHCRMVNWVMDEEDHLKRGKRDAVDALGFTWSAVDGYNDLDQSKFPKESDFLKPRSHPKSELVPKFNTKDGFINQVFDVQGASMRRYIDFVDYLEKQEQTKGPIGHVKYMQLTHPDNGFQMANTTVHDTLRIHCYKQSFSVEELREYDAFYTGWIPTMAMKRAGVTQDEKKKPITADWESKPQPWMKPQTYTW